MSTSEVFTEVELEAHARMCATLQATLRRFEERVDKEQEAITKDVMALLHVLSSAGADRPVDYEGKREDPLLVAVIRTLKSLLKASPAVLRQSLRDIECELLREIVGRHEKKVRPASAAAPDLS